jgi:hypothetical protein
MKEAKKISYQIFDNEGHDPYTHDPIKFEAN